MRFIRFVLINILFIVTCQCVFEYEEGGTHRRESIPLELELQDVKDSLYGHQK